VTRYSHQNACGRRLNEVECPTDREQNQWTITLTFQQVFSFPELGAGTILWAVVLVGTSVALQFPAAVFESVLTGYQRYDLMNVASIVSLLMRTAVIILSLKMGYGILGIAWATFLGSVLLLLLNYRLAVRVYPELSVNFSLAEFKTFAMLGHHSIFAFILIGATRIITDAGNILVGAFVGAAAVTFYAIAGSLTTYALSVIGGISTTIAPRASDLEARGDHEGLKTLCMTGTRFILLIGLPILLTFVLSGDMFVRLWIGEGYGQSYGPLVLLQIHVQKNFRITVRS
jgi:O-antigen/teichoic acid export membrane protein